MYIYIISRSRSSPQPCPHRDGLPWTSDRAGYGSSETQPIPKGVQDQTSSDMPPLVSEGPLSVAVCGLGDGQTG